MKEFIIYSKFYRDHYQKYSQILQIFYDEYEAYNYILESTSCVLHRVMLSESFKRFQMGECDSFGMGAKMYCKVHE